MEDMRSGHHDFVDEFRPTSRACWIVAISILFWLPVRGEAQSSSDAINDVLPRVVKIYGAGGLRNLEAYGTGFLVSPEGHIATVWSHVLDNFAVTVVLNDGRRFEASVLGFEPQLDLAVLKLDEENLELPYFDVNNSITAGPGSFVLGFSNMFNVAAGDEPVSVIHGVIAAKTELITRRGTYESPYDGEVYIVDAATNNSGAAGGVLTTRDGQLLGMIGKELRNAGSNTWVNYAVPIQELGHAIEQIISGQFDNEPTEDPATSEDSLQVSPLNFGLVLIPDVINRTPAYIEAVLPKSPAARAGIQPDDLVLFVNDELVDSCRSFRQELSRLELGDELRLVLRRGEQLITVELPIEQQANVP